MDTTNPDLRLTVNGQTLIVPTVYPIPTQPRKGSLDHPPFGPQQPTHGLRWPPLQLEDKVFEPLHPAWQTILAIGTVRPHRLQTRESSLGQVLQHRPGPHGIRLAGGRDYAGPQ